MVMVTVDVDECEVLGEVSTVMLVDELEDRAKAGDRLARKVLGGDVLAIERAIDHLRAGRPREALEALTLDTDATSFDVSSAWEAARKGTHPFLKVRGRAR
jgi:hypothetical protein